jgi:hypothetical protein
VTLVGHDPTGWQVDPESGIVYVLRGVPIGVVSSSGYLQSGGRGVWHSLHRVVWEACVGPIPDGFWINHLNGVKTDNRLLNLEVCTPGENLAHAHANNLRPSGVSGPSHWCYKVTPEVKSEILRLLGEGLTGAAVARRFGLSGKTISRVRRGVR